jgi:NADH-quinone oxidoreductase subunit E
MDIIESRERSDMKINPQELSKIVDKYHNEKSSLIAVLQDVQERYNWLPPEALKTISEKLSVSLIDVYSVATFYRAFSLTPRGKHVVTVCLGTACHVRGAPTVLDRMMHKLKVEPGCTTPDENFTLESVNCLGACALAPIVVVDGKYYGQTTVQKVDQIVDQYQPKKRKKKVIRRRKK